MVNTGFVCFELVGDAVLLRSQVSYESTDTVHVMEQ